MGTVTAYTSRPPGKRKRLASAPVVVALSTAQTGDGATTNVADRGDAVGNAALVHIAATAGATPACTYLIEGSADGSAWFAASNSDSATPTTWTVTAFTLNSGFPQSVYRIIQPSLPWRFLRITYSANTNVTNTADVTVF